MWQKKPVTSETYEISCLSSSLKIVKKLYGMFSYPVKPNFKKRNFYL